MEERVKNENEGHGGCNIQKHDPPGGSGYESGATLSRAARLGRLFLGHGNLSREGVARTFPGSGRLCLGIGNFPRERAARYQIPGLGRLFLGNSNLSREGVASIPGSERHFLGYGILSRERVARTTVGTGRLFLGIGNFTREVQWLGVRGTIGRVGMMDTWG